MQKSDGTFNALDQEPPKKRGAIALKPEYASSQPIRQWLKFSNFTVIFAPYRIIAPVADANCILRTL